MYAIDTTGLKRPDRQFVTQPSITDFWNKGGEDQPLSLSLRARLDVFKEAFICAEHMSETIQLGVDTERWRWVCPRGHRSWEATNRHFWCARCARNYESDGVFEELRNTATGESFERDEIQLRNGEEWSA